MHAALNPPNPAAGVPWLHNIVVCETGALHWAFNGISAIGEAAVPMQMLILGAKLAEDKMFNFNAGRCGTEESLLDSFTSSRPLTESQLSPVFEEHSDLSISDTATRCSHTTPCWLAQGSGKAPTLESRSASCF